LSLVLKDMKLFSATYQGSPVEPVAGANCSDGGRFG
jgi:hypothetical protein